MTAREMGDLSRSVTEVIHEHTERAKARYDEASPTDSGPGAIRDEGTRRVRLYLNVFPLSGDERSRHLAAHLKGRPAPLL